MTVWTLVTGGAKHLGAEICRTLSSQGHSLVIHFNNSQKEAEELAAACRAKGGLAETLQGDFTDLKSTQDFIGRYLSLFDNTAYLINNMGNYLVKSALQTAPDEWIAIFQNNLHAPFLLAKGLCASLKRHRGAIVNLGVAGLQALRADIYSTGYTSAKLSLLMLTKALARELAPDQVSVNMVSPGYLDSSADLPKDPAQLPMGRLGLSSEVTRLIAYLIHPDNRYITGQNIEVAGAVRL
jgi:NAD(P)-dependent dehydrogenase (short-subunit alcohol dehydrogenase family)